MDNAEHIERLEIAIAELDDAVAVLADLPEPLATVTKARDELRDRLAKLGAPKSSEAVERPFRPRGPLSVSEPEAT